MPTWREHRQRRIDATLSGGSYQDQCPPGRRSGAKVDLRAPPLAIRTGGFCPGGWRDSGTRADAFGPDGQDGLILVCGDLDDACLKAGPGVVLDIGV